MNTWQILEAAADKIERNGWWQECDGGCDDGPSSECLMLAIRCDDMEKQRVADQAVLRALGVTKTGDAYAWNDAPERTKEEVIAMLRAVAASEKARAARLMPVVVEKCHA